MFIYIHVRGVRQNIDIFDAPEYKYDCHGKTLLVNVITIVHENGDDGDGKRSSIHFFLVCEPPGGSTWQSFSFPHPCFWSVREMVKGDMASYPHWSGTHVLYNSWYHKAHWQDVKLYPNKMWSRGYSKKLKKMYTRTDVRHYFFTQRVIDWWNDLPEEVVQAGSVNAFKNRIDKHFRDHPVVYNYKALDNPTTPHMSVT